ncbi:MAG TPA: isoleucine--tRNA ligase, partial [Firmicutes bacterium]|nr:isoleucine--tRNA ligase [Bacillota bacterium]
MDYSKTLNLPQTEFPMRGDLPKREPEMLKWWEEQQVYSKRVAAGKDKPKFILHDGPPYANGNIHMGHALNKVLKDIVIKYKSLQGFNTPYVPGWDTHGLPIEHAAIKILGLNRHQLHPLELRKKCAEYALKYVSIQREDFIRLGVWAEWDNPYVTLKPEYEAKQIEVFGEMAKKGYIYKGLKSVYWCTSCETALAEAEIEYQEKKSHSIYVKFPLVDDKGLLKGIADLSKTYVVIWTTTPWTLPANVAICLNPDFEYAVVKSGPEFFLMAKELVETVAQETGLTDWEILQVFPGK